MREIKLWTIEQDDSGEVVAEAVDSTDHTKTEKQLEDLLVTSPDLLMHGLQLVGRQTPAAGGALDLLGVNEDGNLVVFELKRGVLTRDAVAQVIDYASYLSAMDSEELVVHISQRSGIGGIEKIEDFGSWYQLQFPDSSDGYSNRPSMVLVGLGADEKTKRMVEFLSAGGLDISLVTFHAFEREGTVFLARVLETKGPDRTGAVSPSYTKAENLEALRDLSTRLRSDKLLESVASFIRQELPAYEWPSRSGYSYSLTEQTERGNPSYRVYVSVYVSNNRPGQVQLVFQHRAIEAAKEHFEQLLITHPQRFVKSHGNLKTYVKSESDWDTLTESVKSLLSAVFQGWQEKTKRESQPTDWEERPE